MSAPTEIMGCGNSVSEVELVIISGATRVEQAEMVYLVSSDGLSYVSRQVAELFKAKEMRKSWELLYNVICSVFPSPKWERPVLRDAEVVPILPLALPRVGASKSGHVLPESYNGEFVHCTIEAKKKETTCEDRESVFLCFCRRTKYDPSHEATMQHIKKENKTKQTWNC